MEHVDPQQKARQDVEVALRYVNEKLKALEATGAGDRVRQLAHGLALAPTKTRASGEKPLKIHPK